MLLGASILTNQMWYSIPLVVAVSLVYGATRHELMGPILAHAWRTGFWMLTFIGAIFVLLFGLNWLWG